MKPLDVAELGRAELSERARIIGVALLQGLQGSVAELARGDLTRAWNAAAKAVLQAQEAEEAAERAETAEASRSLGILIVILLVAGCWALEFFLTRRPDEKVQEEQGYKDGSETARFLHALSFARYLFVWHVVLDNYYRPEQQTSAAGTWTTFARWGSLGAPWFFMASGFCNTYSKVSSSKADSHEDWLYAMIKRIAPWYPLYAASLTLGALRLWSVEAEDWSHYMADMLLIHGFIWDASYFPFFLDDWWVCFLMVYLLTWYPMYQVLSNSSNSVIWTLYTIAFLLTIPSAILEWYFMEDWHPWMMIQLWPSFVVGQALAMWFVRNCMQKKVTTAAELREPIYTMRPVHDIPVVVRFGATISFLTLGILVFCFSPHDKLPLIRKPVSPLVIKGGLIPLQALMIVGLACEVDPLAKLWARPPFRWCEKLVFTTFVFQTPIHNMIQDWTGWQGLTWTFSASLLLASLVGHVCLERPWRRILGVREK